MATIETRIPQQMIPHESANEQLGAVPVQQSNFRETSLRELHPGLANRILFRRARIGLAGVIALGAVIAAEHPEQTRNGAQDVGIYIGHNIDNAVNGYKLSSFELIRHTVHGDPLDPNRGPGGDPQAEVDAIGARVGLTPAQVQQQRLEGQSKR